jgi:hypothetical protein
MGHAYATMCANKYSEQGRHDKAHTRRSADLKVISSGLQLHHGALLVGQLLGQATNGVVQLIHLTLYRHGMGRWKQHRNAERRWESTVFGKPNQS